VPTFQKSAKMDIELEVACFVGPGNELGTPIKVSEAEEHMFGLVLMNDWTARDIQPWEMMPLGPFTSKNLGTTISPWIVTLEALKPFRVPSPAKDPPALKYLEENTPSNFDVHLEILLATPKMNEPAVISTSEFRNMYWSCSQQLVQHTVTGCNMRPGDLLGSGTISGPDKHVGSLTELTWSGKNAFNLPNGESRTFLQDGDTVILRGWAQGDGYRVGFGECRGTIIEAHENQ